MMKSIKLTLIAAAVCAASSAFAANYAGEISQADHKPNDRQIKVGEGKTDVHTGKAAINVIDVAATPENPRKGLANGKYISFAKIDETAGRVVLL